MTEPKQYRRIVTHYEDCLDKHGDNHLGVDWPNAADVETRYRVMLDIIRPSTDPDHLITLLDFGCGASHLFDYIQRQDERKIIYSGLDMSAKFVALSQSKYPENAYFCADILDGKPNLPVFDYIAMNGVFTEKRELSFDEMWSYFQAMILRVFEYARHGIAFNVMSKQVDWERDDLFHLPLDLLAAFLVRSVSRSFIIRNDYRLWEYTAYVYR